MRAAGYLTQRTALAKTLYRPGRERRCRHPDRAVRAGARAPRIHQRIALGHRARRPGASGPHPRSERPGAAGHHRGPGCARGSARQGREDPARAVPPPRTREITSVARLLSHALRRATTRPAFALVLAGPRLLVAERERWPEGRYLAVDLQLVAERNDDQAGRRDRPRADLPGRRVARARRRGRHLVDATSSTSRSSTPSGCRKDLREGVRLSIEIIANEVVAPPRARRASTRCPPTRRSRWPSSRCGSSTGSSSCSTPRRRPSWACCRSGAPEYEHGYSLDRLRELTLVELTTPRVAGGHPPLRVARRCSSGSSTRATTPAPTRRTDGASSTGSTFRSLRADLFQPEATAHIDEVGLGNAALQQVLRHLLLSKEASGPRPRLHLLRRARHQPARRGLRGPDVLHRLLRRDGPLRGRQGRRRRRRARGSSRSTRADGIADKDFVTVDGPGHRRARAGRCTSAGTFVFRLAGRERQQSASYYTPEVLTRFVGRPGARGAARPGRHDARPPRRSSS